MSVFETGLAGHAHYNRASQANQAGQSPYPQAAAASAQPRPGGFAPRADSSSLANPFYGASAYGSQAAPGQSARKPSVSAAWLRPGLIGALVLVLLALVVLVVMRLWSLGSGSPPTVIPAESMPERIAHSSAAQTGDSLGLTGQLNPTSLSLDAGLGDNSNALDLPASENEFSAAPPLPETGFGQGSASLPSAANELASPAASASETAGIALPRSRPGDRSRSEPTLASTDRPDRSTPNIPSTQAAVASTIDSGGYRVQFASVVNSDNAFALRDRMNNNRYGGLLDGQQVRVSRAQVNGRTVYRVHALRLSDRGEAQAVCSNFQTQGVDCIVMRN